MLADVFVDTLAKSFKRVLDTGGGNGTHCFGVQCDHTQSRFAQFPSCPG